MEFSMEKRAFGTILSGNRQRNQQFSPEARAAIIAARAEGRTQRSIAEQFQTSQQTIAKILKHYNTTATITPEPRKGRQKKLSPRDIRKIKKTIRQNPRITKQQLVDSLPAPVDARTIATTLREDDLRLRKALKKIPLSAEHAANRLSFVRLWAPRDEDYREVEWFKKGAIFRQH